jgi:hypothetical protein
VANSFEENDCENANTRAQDGEHLVVESSMFGVGN